MGEKLEGSAAKKAVRVSLFLIVLCALVLFSNHDPISAAIGVLFLSLILLGIVRFVNFVTGSESLDITPMLEEVQKEVQARESRDPFKMPFPGGTTPRARAMAQKMIGYPAEPNPERIIGADNRALVERARAFSNREQGERASKEPDLEAEEERAWAEMMRVL